jgi:FKBP-type peptidyl-prolyl cis-trans isomerase FklB
MKTIKFLIVAILATSLVSCNGQGVTNKSLKTEIDSVSYAAGLDMAYKIQQSFDEADKDLFIQGYRNGIDSTNLLLEKKDLQNIISTYFRNKQQEAAKEKAAEGEKTKLEGENFLAENKTKDGVITTESGLQYIVLKEGTGEMPKLTDRVKVHYHGTLIDGTVFDSSVDKGKPYETPLTQVVKGWTEALQLMKVGSKIKLFVPQELGYGANPRPGGAIKPFMPLIFEMELLEIL